MKTQMLFNNPQGLNTLIPFSLLHCIEPGMMNGSLSSSNHENNIIIVVEELD